MDRRNFLLASSLGLASLAAPVLALASPWYLDGPLAVSGYDPVAYFTQGQPVLGDKAITSAYEGATFAFSSSENKAEFEANPAKYAPQYGGYCAYAAALNAKAHGDPQAWTIADDKLFLNFSKSVRSRWEADKDTYISQADALWPVLKNQ